MAKQRRPPPKAAPRKARRKPTVPKTEPAPAPGSSLLEKRASYLEAVALYERGLEALQRHEFRAAEEALRRVLEQYPDERELHERARLYLKICERETGPPPPRPQTVEERVYAATLALNAGAHEQALRHLQPATDERPDDDHVHYMLAVVHTLRHEGDLAITYLRRAIDLNPDNRTLARQEPDFEPIRRELGFRQAVSPPPTPRRRPRGRTPR